MTPHRRRMDRSTLEMLLYTSPPQQGYTGQDPFIPDDVKAAFIPDRETRKSVREEQLNAREEAGACDRKRRLKPWRRIPSSRELVA